MLTFPGEERSVCWF